jgi:formimidoylglutamate deiminase
MPVHMHVSEQVGEVEDCVGTHGVTPLEWVANLVDIDAHWCFIHATHLTQLEMRRLAGTGAAIGLCPATEANLGDGIFELERWLEADAPWGIGGDSHVSVSPFEELRALEYSQRLRQRVRNVSASEQSPDVAGNLWRRAAEGGAQALAQPSGALAPGRRADLVILDGSDVDFEALAAPAMLGVAMFSGNLNRVRDVFLAGAPVVTQGRHPAAEDAAAGYRAALRRLRATP